MASNSNPHNLLTMMKITLFKLTTLTSAVLLAACGGGSDTGTTPQTPTPQVTQSVALVSSVAEPTYVRGSGEQLAFDYLNNERTHCGFGKVAQSTQLDVSGLNHASYRAANPTSDPHLEVAGRTGFSGVSPTDRARVAGYVTTATEVLENGHTASIFRNLNFTAAYDSNALPRDAIRSLLGAPYHAINGAFTPTTDFGVGFHRNESTVNGIQQVDAQVYFQFGYGTTALGQLPPDGTGVRTYPCQGTSNIEPAFYAEYTGGVSITPDRNTGLNPLGHPIIVIGEHGKTLELTSATITQLSSGANLPIYLLRTKANDPNAFLYRNDWSGYVFPDQPFVSGQQYRATVNGKSGGVAFSKTFVFGVGNPPLYW